MVGLSNSEQTEKSKIIFIGGPHGVGKSTALEELKKLNRKEEARLNIVSMSNTLHRASMERYSKSIAELNEDRLKRDELQVEMISKLRSLDFAFTLLDGHYVTMSSEGAMCASYNTDANYFIRFDAQVVLTSKPEEIRTHRIKRNKEIWSIDLDVIRQEQEREVSEAYRIGGIFSTPVYVIENDSPKKAAKRIWKLLKVLNI